MRFNFKNVGEGLSAIADYKNRKDDAEAYKRATEVTNPEDEAALQSYRGTATGLRGQMTGAEGGVYDTEDSGYQPGVVGLTGAASAYDKAAASGAKYRMGGAEYDTAPTDQQKRMAGLAATRDMYAGKGLRKEAAEAGVEADRARATADASQLHGLQMKNAEMDLSTKARSMEAQKRVDAVRASWADPGKKMVEYFNMDHGKFGEGNNAGKKMNATKMPDGSGYLGWQVDKDGKQVGEAKVFPMEEVQQMAQHQMLGELAAVDPEKYLERAIKEGHTRDQLKATVKHYADSSRHQLEMEKLTGRHYDNEAKRISQMTARANEAIERQFNTPVGVSDDGKALYSHPKKRGLFTVDKTGELQPFDGDISRIKGIGGPPREGKPEPEVHPELAKKVIAEFGDLPKDDPKALGAFMARYGEIIPSIPGLSKIGGSLKISGAGGAAPPAAGKPVGLGRMTDSELKAQGTFGRMTSDASLARAVELGIPAAIQEEERRAEVAAEMERYRVRGSGY